MALPHHVASSAMQNRIQELLAKHPPIFTLETAETSSYPTASLLGLPSELRLHIYKYALWHQQSDGLICPAPDLRVNRNYVLATVTNNLWRYSENERVDDGSRLGAVYRFNMRGNDIVPENLLRPPPLGQPQGQNQAQAVLAHSLARQRADAHNAVEIQRQLYNKSVTALESVPRIHDGQCRRGEWSPVDWWRGIEDMNLRAIDNLVLALDGPSLAWEPLNPAAVVHKKRKNSHKITVVGLAGRPVDQQASADAQLRVPPL
ncbi:hypothetical protein LTR78_006586 [Recurvomyces mirabilis]|uniref:Uncharacterized protein n=1 Tax=Recurvomyces mirabilis TaxID=574656 RepID=A0AAE0WL14_9PEZI|nr:hypothetical protein LTR78_006586 [Recurvomyces mirabilis]KAK5154682.1 hypothetical protein LTS14_006261 [Recurvomyces mirabilis]